MTVIGDQIGLTLARIVLATDFSPASDRAAGYARDLARRFSSSLTLAHVIDLSVATRSEEALVGTPLDEMRHASTENPGASSERDDIRRDPDYGAYFGGS
jgi:nucleotide-binding universal stress UspA family protein